MCVLERKGTFLLRTVALSLSLSLSRYRVRFVNSYRNFSQIQRGFRALDAERRFAVCVGHVRERGLLHCARSLAVCVFRKKGVAWRAWCGEVAHHAVHAHALSAQRDSVTRLARRLARTRTSASQSRGFSAWRERVCALAFVEASLIRLAVSHAARFRGRDKSKVQWSTQVFLVFE